MKKLVFIISSLCFLVMAQAQTTKAVAPKTAVARKTAVPTATSSLKNTKDSASYALGYRIAQSLKGQGLQDVNVALFNKGMAAGVLAKPEIPDTLLDICIKNYQDKMSQNNILQNRAIGAESLANNAKRPGVVKLTSGLQYEVLVAGTGTQKPTLNNKVKCHYHGTLIDGTVFDSSVQRGEPISFPLNGVIKGWQDALQLMTVGSKWKLFIPSELAYGERSAGPVIGPGSTLVFEVELLGID